MGVAIEEKKYTKQDFENFQKVLDKELRELRKVMDGSQFDSDPIQLGAELEMYLVTREGAVSCNNLELLKMLNDEQFQTELNRYNLELNLSTVSAKGKPFTAFRNEMQQKVGVLQEIAEKENTLIIPVGILPTLDEKHLSSDYITPIPRYKMLSKQLIELKGEPFNIDIDGDDPLKYQAQDVTLEGANTSFQVHLMTGKNQFKDTFNAALLTAPIVNALSANSAVFLGHKLWDETRIALFKQSIDIRVDDSVSYRKPARVSFGYGWVRDDAWELFAESVSLYPAIFPQINTTDEKNSNGLPNLNELSLHMGTLWPWHRPVYSHQGNGHVRIEFRAIPAGPTSLDMSANAALAIGLAVGLKPYINELIGVIPFRFAEYNFYRSAKNGLDAKILWKKPDQFEVCSQPVAEIATRLLPFAYDGLKQLGVDDEEISRYLGLIENRLNTGMTGARWQKNTLRYFESQFSRKDALNELVKLYIVNTESCVPVAEWERPWESV